MPYRKVQRDSTGPLSIERGAIAAGTYTQFASTTSTGPRPRGRGMLQQVVAPVTAGQCEQDDGCRA
jgi:hypothetical protein